MFNKEPITWEMKQKAMEILAEEKGVVIKAVNRLAKDHNIVISRQALSRWKKKPPERSEGIFIHVPPASKIKAQNNMLVVDRKGEKASKIDMEEASAEFISLRLLTRINALIPSEKNMNALASALRTVNEIRMMKKDKPDNETSLVQTIYNDIKKRQNEIKDRTQGDIQDVAPISE